MSFDFSQLITAEHKAAEALAAVKNRIAARRWEEETRGITINGTFINTERESQGLLNGAAVSAMLDSEYVCRWKTPAGFIALPAATILAVATAVRMHVQACFDREGDLLEELANETFTESMLEEGWPV